jgi:hypothetical protein
MTKSYHVTVKHYTGCKVGLLIFLRDALNFHKYACRALREKQNQPTRRGLYRQRFRVVDHRPEL